MDDNFEQVKLSHKRSFWEHAHLASIPAAINPVQNLMGCCRFLARER